MPRSGSKRVCFPLLGTILRAVEEDQNPRHDWLRQRGKGPEEHRCQARCRGQEPRRAGAERSKNHASLHCAPSGRDEVCFWNLLSQLRNNTIKDYVNVAGPLGVSHIIVLSQQTKYPKMRLGCYPHGPTLHFRVWFSAHSQSVDHRLLSDEGHHESSCPSAWCCRMQPISLPSRRNPFKSLPPWSSTTSLRIPSLSSWSSRPSRTCSPFWILPKWRLKIANVFCYFIMKKYNKTSILIT